MIAAIYARKSTDQHVADEEKLIRHPPGRVLLGERSTGPRQLDRYAFTVTVNGTLARRRQGISS
jgi:hypothetical protein